MFLATGYQSSCCIFDKTASTFWNNLPSETQNEQSLEIFKKNVKTYLFRIAYYDLL
jgi:hypothetical protein